MKTKFLISLIIALPLGFLVLTGSSAPKKSSEGSDSPVIYRENQAVSAEALAVTSENLRENPVKINEVTNTVPAHKLTLKEKIVTKIAARKINKAMEKSGLAKTMGDNQLVALLLCIFVGGLGIHRFYLGYTGVGILMLLTGGLCGILWLIDLIRIIVGDLQPRDGSYGQTL